MTPIESKMFDMAEKFSKKTKGEDLIYDWRLDAKAGREPDWKKMLHGYVRGLWAAGVISEDDMDDWYKLKNKDDLSDWYKLTGGEK